VKMDLLAELFDFLLQKIQGKHLDLLLLRLVNSLNELTLHGVVKCYAAVNFSTPLIYY